MCHGNGRLRRGLASLTIATFLWASVPSPGWSQEVLLQDPEFEPAAEASAPTPAPVDPEEGARQTRIRSIEQRLVAAQQVIRGLQNELRALKGAPLSPQPTGPVVQTETGDPTQIARAPAPPPRGAPAPRRSGPPSEEERAVSPTQEIPDFTPGALRETRAVLMRPGMFEIDPRLRYEYSRRDVLDVSGVNIVEAVFVGTFRIGEVTVNRVAPSLNFRYGLSRDFQLNASIPYSFVDRETILPDTVQSAIDEGIFSDERNSALGDITAGFSYHLWKESDLLPDIILTTSVKSDTGDGPFDVDFNEPSTGTGFWGATVGLTAVKVSDPGVLFGNVGYFYHKEDKVRGRDFDPPDSIDWGLGYSWAMNPYLNLTTRLEGRFVEETRIDGRKIDGSDLTIANLGLGLTYAYSPTGAVDFFAQMGLTDDSPDFSIVVSRPFLFNFSELVDDIF